VRGRGGERGTLEGQAKSSEIRQAGGEEPRELFCEEEDCLSPASELEAEQRVGLEGRWVGEGGGLGWDQAPGLRDALLELLGEGVGDEGVESRVERWSGVEEVEEVFVRRRDDHATRRRCGGGEWLVELGVVEELMETLVKSDQGAADERGSW
jgi:hypothetical protein